MIHRIPIGRLGIHHKQHEISVDGALLILRDHRNEEAAPGAVTIEAGAVTRANVADVNFPECSLFTGSSSESMHAVCHLSEDRTAVQFLQGGEPPPLIALEASRAESGMSQAHDSKANIVWLSMKSREAYRKVDLWLPEFMDLDFDTATKIAQAANRGSLDLEIQRRYAHLLDITHPGDATAELAFRLLCESVVLCKGEATGKVGDIPITAPTQIRQWLTPFSPAGTTDDQKIEALVTMMGADTTKTAVREVFKAVKANSGVIEAAKTFPGVPEYTTTQQQPVEDAQ